MPDQDPHEKHYKNCSLIVFMLVRLLLAGKSLPALSTREHNLKNAQSLNYLLLEDIKTFLMTFADDTKLGREITN
jgi:hypothetical protein